MAQTAPKSLRDPSPLAREDGRGGGPELGAPRAWSSSPVPADRWPFFAACRPCGHRWPIAYLPMHMATAAALFRAARCPLCGTTGADLGIAKQRNGMLLPEGEEVQP